MQIILIDTFRHFKPDEKRYTWRKHNPIKQARLDYCFVSSQFIQGIGQTILSSLYI
jgi:exonuclease III